MRFDYDRSLNQQVQFKYKTHGNLLVKKSPLIILWSIL